MWTTWCHPLRWKRSMRLYQALFSLLSISVSSCRRAENMPLRNVTNKRILHMERNSTVWKKKKQKSTNVVWQEVRQSHTDFSTRCVARMLASTSFLCIFFSVFEQCLFFCLFLFICFYYPLNSEQPPRNVDSTLMGTKNKFVPMQICFLSLHQNVSGFLKYFPRL